MNQITENGFHILSKKLKFLPTLINLKIGNKDWYGKGNLNVLGDTGLEYLLENIKFVPKLELLDLG